MNKKQVIVLACLILIGLTIGIVRGLNAIRTGVKPEGLTIGLFTLIVVLSTAGLSLGIAFRDKKDEIEKEGTGDRGQKRQDSEFRRQ